MGEGLVRGNTVYIKKESQSTLGCTLVVKGVIGLLLPATLAPRYSGHSSICRCN